MYLRRHAGCCCICSIIKINIFLSLQCFLILSCSSSELLSCSRTAYPTPGLQPQNNLQPSGHPSIYLYALRAPGQQGKEEKPWNIHHAYLPPRKGWITNQVNSLVLDEKKKNPPPPHTPTKKFNHRRKNIQSSAKIFFLNSCTPFSSFPFFFLSLKHTFTSCWTQRFLNLMKASLMTQKHSVNNY